MGTSLDTTLVIEALEMAVRQRRPAGPVIHHRIRVVSTRA